MEAHIMCLDWPAEFVAAHPPALDGMGAAEHSHESLGSVLDLVQPGGRTLECTGEAVSHAPVGSGSALLRVLDRAQDFRHARALTAVNAYRTSERQYAWTIQSEGNEGIAL